MSCTCYTSGILSLRIRAKNERGSEMMPRSKIRADYKTSQHAGHVSYQNGKITRRIKKCETGLDNIEKSFAIDVKKN